jgi:hypothetical protein
LNPGPVACGDQLNCMPTWRLAFTEKMVGLQGFEPWTRRLWRPAQLHANLAIRIHREDGRAAGI